MKKVLKQLLIACLMLTTAFASGQNYPSLMNNTPGAKYNGFSLTPGETAEHYSFRPNITKVSGKKILVLGIGASTHAQQYAALQIMTDAQLTDVKFLNVAASSHDIGKWLSLSSSGWKDLKSKVTAAGYNYSDVQAIIFGTDDLRSKDTTFPRAPQNLSAKIIDFIALAKAQFPNLKQVDLLSRLCEYQIEGFNGKFDAPSAYQTCWADKFTVESSFASGHLLYGVWVTDATGIVWTNGEIPNTGTINGIGATTWQFRFSWMKPGDVHMNTSLQGDEIVAGYILTNYKRYAWVK